MQRRLSQPDGRYRAHWLAAALQLAPCSSWLTAPPANLCRSPGAAAGGGEENEAAEQQQAAGGGSDAQDDPEAADAEEDAMERTPEKVGWAGKGTVTS